MRPPMGKYTRLLTPEEYNALSTDERLEYILDAAEILKGSRASTPRDQQPQQQQQQQPQDQEQQQQPEASPDPDQEGPPETPGAKK